MMTEDQYHHTLFTTPRKETTTNSDFNSEKKSTPEFLFTPLKIPGSTKNDDAYTRQMLLRSQCYCIPEFGSLALSHIPAAFQLLEDLLRLDPSSAKEEPLRLKKELSCDSGEGMLCKRPRVEGVK